MASYVPAFVPPLLRLTGAIAPALAARIMGELVSRPRGRNPTQPWEFDAHPAEREVELRPGLYARVTGEEGPLLIGLHGWRGRPTQFRPLAAALLARGWRTIAIDAPGHGRSAGAHATPRLFGELLIEVERLAGPAHAIVGHSFGGAAAGAALALGQRPPRLVVASSPTRVSRIPFALARTAGLPARALPHYERLLDRWAGRPVAELDLVVTAPRAGVPTLLLHDVEDAVIPYSEAEALMAAWPAVESMATRGIRHRDLLGDPAVVERIVRFVVAPR